MRSRPSIAVSCVLLFASAVVARAKDEKLKPEQLIAKHLESIGPAANLKEIKTRSTGGAARVDFLVGGSGSLSGQGNVASNGTSVRAAFMFPALDYRGEEFRLDGDKTSIAQVNPGAYSLSH